MSSHKRAQKVYCGFLGLLCVVVAYAVRWNAASKQEDKLGVVRFPKVWTKKITDGSEVAFADLRGFEVRKKAGAQTEELIFAMKGLVTNPQGRVESTYSDDFYAVSLDGDFHVRPATAEEWKRAERLPNTRREIRYNRYRAPSEPITHTDDDVLHQGKKYRKSGKFWPNPSALISSTGKWLAVFSFSSSAKPETSWSPLDGGMPLEPTPGEIFVDVYDTSSGQLVQTGKFHYDGSPSMLFAGALWAGDDYLVVPVDPIRYFDVAGQACVLGILPRR